MIANIKNKISADTAVTIRRAIFCVLLLGFAIIAVFFTFRGLSSPRGMEQAQVAREIARGNGFTTKVIRPITVWQMEEKNQAKEEVASFKMFPETYHAPINPCVYAAVLKAVDGGNQERWKMPLKSNIYQLDRIIAGVCVLFFIIAIGVNYLLISRIFDTTIASTVAVLMLFCELMWKFSQSGMPQMLMLLLFSCAMFFLWLSIENTAENKPAIVPVMVTGLFLCLLVLTHWITIWIYFGFVIFAAIYFKPRGILALILMGLLAVLVLPIIYIIYSNPTGSFFGTAYYAIHNGLGSSQDDILRSLSPADHELGLKSLLINIVATTLGQISNLHANLGAILVAPLFFIALLHPFKRQALGMLRWPLLLMWLFAGIGMSVYGLKDESLDSNQIHILFAPLMAAYGIAMVSILWARLGIAQRIDSLRHAHLILIVIISAGPMLLSIPKDVKLGLRAEGIGGFPHWPPYYPKAINHTIAENTTSKDVIISDVPWAVAWYADRISVWLPQNLEQIERIEALAIEQHTPVSSILITPYSFNGASIMSIATPKASYGELYPLVFNIWGRMALAKPFIDTHEAFKPLSRRYPHDHALISYGLMNYYSKRPVTYSID
ncbi:MAG: hypothetical protein ACPIA7_04335 [Akkermansiaceae bacterium]